MNDGKYNRDQDEAAGIIQPKGQDENRVRSAHQDCNECSSMTKRMQYPIQVGK